MAAITICSDFGAQINEIWHCFHSFPIYLVWSDVALFISFLISGLSSDKCTLKRTQGSFFIFGEAPMSLEGQVFTIALLPILNSLAEVFVMISLIIILLHFFFIFIFGVILHYYTEWNFKSWSYDFCRTE